MREADPTVTTSPSRIRYRVLALAVAALGALLVVLGGAHGPGVTPDSIQYASVAASVAHHLSLTQFDGHPLTLFPPGYPLALGLLVALGLSINAAAVVLNALALFVALLAVVALLDAVLERATIALLGALVLLTPAAFLVATMLWSETLFVAASLTALAVLARALRRGALSRPLAVVLVIGVVLATATRYTGILLVPVTFAGLLALPGPRRARLLRAGVVSTITLVPLAAICARNVALGQPPFGARVGAVSTLSATLSQLLATIGQFTGLSGLPGTVVAWLVLAAFLAGLVLALRARHLAVLLLGGYALVYLATIVLSEITTTIDPVGPRLLVPVVVPVLSVVLYGLVRLNDRFAPASRGLLALCLAGAVTLGGVSTVRATVNQLRHPVAPPASPLTSWLAHLPEGVGVVAPQAALMYWLSGHAPMLYLPTEDFYCSPTCFNQQLRDAGADVVSGVVRYVVIPGRISPRGTQLFASVGVRLRFERRIAGDDVYAASPLTRPGQHP